MTNDCYVLAETPGLGRIYDCGSCHNIHLELGAMSIALTRAAYLQVVELVHTSAANFELLVEQNARQSRKSASA